jgi:hypothetical protein
VDGREFSLRHPNRLIKNQFFVDNFRYPLANVIHLANSFHLICGFELFGYAFSSFIF